MRINFSNARRLLKQLDLRTLFTQEMNWNSPDMGPFPLTVPAGKFLLTPVAEKGGVLVLTAECKTTDDLPDKSARLALHTKLTEQAFEHIIVFVNMAHTSTVWLRVEREGGRRKGVHEDRFHVSETGERLLQKLEGIAFDWSELDEDGQATIFQVTDKISASLATDKVTKRFYDDFQKQHAGFLKFIEGIEGTRDREWYASIMLNRLMFIYFIQKKGFLGGDTGYLRARLTHCQKQRIPYYRGFLTKLFFEGFACKPEERAAATNALLGEVPYLNGGLFLPHQIEEANDGIAIPDAAFETIFAFFDRYDWHLDTRPLRADNEINPDVLGYIFEKYINQKQMGAYYTKEDITEYITKNTVLPFLFDKLKSFQHDAVVPLPIPDIEPYIHDAVKKGADLDLPCGQNGRLNIAAGLDDVSQRGDWNRRADGDYALPTETWREHIARRQRYQRILDDFAAGRITTINDFITYNLDIIAFAKDFIGDTQDPLVVRAFYFDCLKTLTVLDPTCGSGAFLFAALTILEDLYELCLLRMQEFLERAQRHPQWAQPFEEELAHVNGHPSRRYFIYKSIIVRNLYGVDIMEEAVEICKLRLFLRLVAQIEDVAQIEPLPDIDFNIRAGNTLVGYASLEGIEQAKTGRLDFGGIVDRVKAVDRHISTFRSLQTRSGISAQHFREAKENLQRELRTLEAELNRDLAFEYGHAKEKDVTGFVQSHKPFHWYVEFYDIMAHGGFDVVIGNPPYVEYAAVKRDYAVRGYQTEGCGNLYAFVAERALGLSHRSSRLGLILPLSSFSTDRMAALAASIQERCGALWLSNYGVRPSKLFDGVEFRLAIVLAELSPDRECEEMTTGFIRWHSEERPDLLKANSYCPVSRQVSTLPSIPKVSSPTGRRVLSALFARGTSTVGDMMQRAAADSAVFYQEATNYWVKATDRVPFYEKNGEQQVAAHSRMLYAKGKREAAVVCALMNSSLFYVFFNMLTDCYHLSDTAVRGFPVCPDLVADQRLGALSSRLMDRLENDAEVVAISTKAGDTIRYASFTYLQAKPIVDEIDRVLAEHYGFTDEELDFIINYDIKYRMGADEGEEA